MPDFNDILQTAIETDDLLGLVLSQPCANGSVACEKLTIRPIELRGERHYQWAARSSGQETHENLSPTETVSKANALFASIFAEGYLFTSQADFAARMNRKGKLKITESRPTKSRPASTASHNRTKQYLLPENTPSPFLTEIGVMTPAGKVKANRYKKFRQINRFLELVNDVVPHLPSEGILKVVDFGCGKSYLTFALHYLLREIHKRDVRIVGLDRKSSVVRDCQAIAERLNCVGLEFREGDIWNHQEERIHLAVSLHACDTATDDALAKAITWEADAILAVPCCQHEIAAKLPSKILASVQQHGILKDRLAAIFTDSLRAAALESLGYKTRVVEFIDMEHTAKNVLIRAIRRDNWAANTGETEREYQKLKAEVGIETFHLDQALEKLRVNV